MADELRIVTTTFPDRECAEEAARLLVEAGLAVCAQVGSDLVSFYRWRGQRERSEEVPVVCKVLATRFDLFVGELKLQHPYDVPEIVSWPAGWVDPDYLAWARSAGGDTDG